MGCVGGRVPREWLRVLFMFFYFVQVLPASTISSVR